MEDMAEKIKIVLIKQNMTVTELAEKFGISRNAMYNRLHRNNFTTQDLEKIADIMDCDYKSGFEIRKSKEYV